MRGTEVAKNDTHTKTQLASAEGSIMATQFGPSQVCDDACHEDWLNKTTKSMLLEQFVEKKGTPIPGAVPTSSDPPSDLVETLPSRPALNVLVWMKDVPNIPNCPAGVKFPAGVLDKWHSSQQILMVQAP